MEKLSTCLWKVNYNFPSMPSVCLAHKEFLAGSHALFYVGANES